MSPADFYILQCFVGFGFYRKLPRVFVVLNVCVWVIDVMPLSACVRNSLLQVCWAVLFFNQRSMFNAESQVFGLCFVIVYVGAYT